MANSIKIEVFSLTALQIANGVTITSAYPIVDNTVLVNIQNMTSVFWNIDYFFDKDTKTITWSPALQSNLVVGDNISINYEEESNDGNAWNVTNQYNKTLTSDDILKKFLIIPESMASDNVEFNVRHAPEQIVEYPGIVGYDFDVNLNADMITWNGMALDGQLVAGDEVSVIYPVIDPVGRRIREQHTISGDILTDKEVTLLCERIPDSSITVEVRGAPSQALSSDFMADLDTVSWATTSLSGELAEGDEIAIIYHTQHGMGINPYKVVIEYAKEDRWGLASELNDNVRSKLKYTSKDVLTSALAIRKAIEIIDTNIYQANASTSAYSIYDYSTNVTVSGTGLIPASLDAVIGGKNIEKTYYRPIEVSGGYASIKEGDEVVEIGTVSIEDLFTTRLTGDVDRFSVQGGRYQHGMTVTEADVTTEGKVIGKANPNDVIGKIFLRLFKEVEDRDTIYSLGTEKNPTRFIKEFKFEVSEVIETVSGDTTVYKDAPIGLFEGWQYGNELINKEYIWLNDNDFPITAPIGASTAEIIENELPIMLYSSRSAVTDPTERAQLSGQIGVAIFYDKANFSNTFGYLMGSSTDVVEKLNMYTDTIFVTQMGPNINNLKSYVSQWNGDNNIYCAGGGTSLTAGGASIQKYDILTDTFSVIPAELLQSLSGACAGTSKEYMYIFGGEGDVGLSGLASKLNYATETVEGNYFVSEFDRINAGCVSLQEKIYMFGGFESTTGTLLSGIAQYDTITDTAEELDVELNSYRKHVKGFAKNRGSILMVGGENLTGFVPTVERYNIANETISEVDGPLVPVSRGMVVQDKVNGYYCGGICNYGGEIKINIIQKCIMASNTWEIMNEQTSSRKSEQDSSSTVPFDVFVSQ